MVTGMSPPSRGFYGASGIGGPTIEEISSIEASITHDPYDDKCKLKTSGPFRQIALLLLQEALKRKETQTYTYLQETHVPSTVSWGPFIFKTQSFECDAHIPLRIKYSDSEILTIHDITEEINKLHKLKAFW